MSHFPLDEETRFGVVHHRKLNSREGLEDTLPALAELPQFAHIVEGDLCWARSDDGPILYFHHPDLLVDTMSDKALQEAVRSGSLWSLEDALDERYGDLIFIVELKMGRGSRREAVAEAVRHLQTRRPGRFWVDTFSLRDARLLKETDPAVSVSLHVKFLTGSIVLKTALEFPPVSLRTVSGLRHVDVLTLTYKTSFQRLMPWTGITTENTSKGLRASGKSLVYGGVATRAMLARVAAAGAKAGYIKFDWRQLAHAMPGS